MNANEWFLFLLSAKGEFDALCQQIVHDGRDPLFVAYGLLERLTRSMQKYQMLWEARQ